MVTLSKVLVKKTTLYLSFITLFFFANASIATTPNYLGSYCFLLSQTSPTTGSVYQHVGVTYSGDVYFLLQAYTYNNSDPTNNPNPTINTGSAVALGGNIFVTLTGGYSNGITGITGGHTLQWTLDDTLNGTFVRITTYSTGAIDTSSGSVKLISCP